MKWTIPVCVVAACLCFAAVSGEESRTPAEWVMRLGADHLAERDAASAALLELGSKARDAVRAALNSPDAEVQWRAQELWKTLRWQVVPDAAADTQALVEESEQKKETRDHWREFVKKHGAESIRLMAEFYADKIPGYEKGRDAILEDANPLEVAQVIARSGTGRPSFLQPLDDLTPDRVAPNAAVNLMQIEIVLWNYQKAFDFGRDVWLRTPNDEVEAQCMVAVDRGKLFDSVNETALKDIAAETDNGRLSKKLSFYMRIFSSTGNQAHITALCDAAASLDATRLNEFELQQLVQSYTKAKLPAYAIKALRNARNPLELYMRSRAELQMNATGPAEADWNMIMTVLDEGKNITKAHLFSLGELMRQWHDKRAGLIYERILAITPSEPVYDSNACFRLGQMAEEEEQYRRAVDFMEKGLVFAKGAGGIIIVTGNKKGEIKSGEESVQEQIKKLRALAAGENPIATKQASPGATPQPSAREKAQ